MNGRYERDERTADWTLWSCVLAPPMFWLVQFQILYTLVPWVCKTGLRWVLWTAGAASIAIAALLLLHAFKRWRSDRACPPRIGAVSSRPFLAALGLGSAALFLLAVIVQVAAQAFVDPCLG